VAKRKHSEGQIRQALKSLQGGRTADDVAQELGVSRHTVYSWKAKYWGMDATEVEELKQLREENSRLKKLIADLILDSDVLQSALRRSPPGS